MSDQAIDEAILSVLSAAGGRWRKLAMVISKVANAVNNDLPEREKAFQVIAQRIEALVRDGRLVAQGDIKKWRFSEVRLPN